MVAAQMERCDYDAALQLRSDLGDVMRRALTPSSVILMPILAGAAPLVKKHGAPLEEGAQAIVDLTEKFAALVAMAGCPAAVLPVPPVAAGGAPWAVLLMGRARCDLQLQALAVKLSQQVGRTAARIAQVRAAPASVCMAAPFCQWPHVHVWYSIVVCAARCP